MPFLSFSFIVLFVVSFILCYSFKGKFRNPILLLVSSIFIGWFHIIFLITAIAVGLFTYSMAIVLENRARERKPIGAIYAISIIALVFGWLAFHYGAELSDYFELTRNSSSFKQIIIPLGLSFYTFQAIGYLTEVYWQELKAERNPVDFMLYMLFFMKFLSGPIESGGSLLKQLKSPKPFEYSNIVSGLKLMFWGLFKKLLIANYLSPHTDQLFSSIHELSGIQLLMLCLIYPVELYADFSGYTDMAIGGAKMLGLKLTPNFSRPFAARSTSELWRRWHMSLSFWVRDYVYVPLTAITRKWGRWGLFFSLIITFIGLGIWHGVGWKFVVYGFIQGLIIYLEAQFPFFSKLLNRIVGVQISNLIMVIRTYLLFAFSLIFFRANSFSDAIYFIRNISFRVYNSYKEVNLGICDHSIIVIAVALTLMLVFEKFSEKNDSLISLEKVPIWFRWGIYYIVIFVLLMYGKFGGDSFIYLQF